MNTGVFFSVQFTGFRVKIELRGWLGVTFFSKAGVNSCFFVFGRMAKKVLDFNTVNVYLIDLREGNSVEETRR